MTSNKATAARKAYTVLLVIVSILLLQPKGGTWSWIYDIRWLYLLILSFVLAQLITPLAIKLAFRFNILDHPGERKIHNRPIPRIGGMAVFAAVMLCSLRNFQFSAEIYGLLAGSSIIYILGLVDDIRPLKAVSRIIIQLLACAVVIFSGCVLTLVPNYVFGHISFNYLLTALWLLGMANAFNFMDGVDGLVTGMAVICSFIFFLSAWPMRESSMAYLTIALCGACMGFLPYNFRPAKVFLGDSGATFIGFFLSGLALLGTWNVGNSILSVTGPLIILGIPIFDMIYTTVSRVKNGQVKSFVSWLEYAARDHFHHRLMQMGFSQINTVFFIWGLNLCLGLGVLAAHLNSSMGSIVLFGQAIIVFLIIVVLMQQGKKLPE